MNLIIDRTHYSKWAIDGELKIEGQKICDTSENRQYHLLPGTYIIEIFTCPHYHRMMPVVISDTLLPAKCHLCRNKPIGSSHAILPLFCPQIKSGNGVANRTDGSIIIGDLRLPGFMFNTSEHFDRLIDRLDKAANRGECITLTINDL